MTVSRATCSYLSWEICILKSCYGTVTTSCSSIWKLIKATAKSNTFMTSFYINDLRHTESFQRIWVQGQCGNRKTYVDAMKSKLRWYIFLWETGIVIRLSLIWHAVSSRSIWSRKRCTFWDNSSTIIQEINMKNRQMNTFLLSIFPFLTVTFIFVFENTRNSILVSKIPQFWAKAAH